MYEVLAPVHILLFWTKSGVHPWISPVDLDSLTRRPNASSKSMQSAITEHSKLEFKSSGFPSRLTAVVRIFLSREIGGSSDLDDFNKYRSLQSHLGVYPHR
ncbi:hypothetical protein Tco_0456017 [Tanacetum coccineum]